MTYYHMQRDANGVWNPGYWEITKEDEIRIRQAALDAFINEGMLSTSIEYANLEFDLEDYFSKEEITLLEHLEKNASDYLWDQLTVRKIENLFKLFNSYLETTDKRKVA